MPPMYLQHCCQHCLQYCYNRRTSAAGSKQHCRSLPPIYQWCLAWVNFTSMLGGKIGMVLLLVTSAVVSEQVVQQQQLYVTVSLVAYENQRIHCMYLLCPNFLFVCLFLQRAWQGDEIASLHLSNIVGEDIASCTCACRHYMYIASFM